MGGGAGKQQAKYQVKTIQVQEAWGTEVKKADRPSMWGHWDVPRSGEVLVMTADVGGTSSRLHVFMAPAEHELMSLAPSEIVCKDRILHTRKYRNASFDSFLEIVRTFMREVKLEKPPVLACLGVAGVVVDNSVRFVNLGWTVDGSELQVALGIARVTLINDFEAQGYGLLTIDNEKDCDCIQAVEAVKGAPCALVGAGTGLGEAFLTTSENGDYDVWPSEGGHAEFAPRQDGASTLEFEMLQYLQIKYSARSRVSVERVVSGKGIANIYEFLSWRFPEQKSPAVHKRFLAAGFDPAVVVEAATSGECELSLKAIEMFVGALGSECGVVALKFMPMGGLYLTGGVTSKTKDFILGKLGTMPHHFMDAFGDKGRVSQMLSQIPVYIVREEDLGERGVRYKACRLWEEMQRIRRPSKGHMSDCADY